MASDYNRRLRETEGRPLQENINLYHRRKSRGQDVGILERVIAEQGGRCSSSRPGEHIEPGSYPGGGNSRYSHYG